jgi:hypothetical protein
VGPPVPPAPSLCAPPSLFVREAGGPLLPHPISENESAVINESNATHAAFVIVAFVKRKYGNMRGR